MREFMARLRNRFTLPAGASIVVGLGMTVIFTFLPNTDWVSANQARMLVFVGVGLVAVGIALGVAGILRTQVPDVVRLFRIVPLLHSAMSRLWEMAEQEATKPIDWNKYGRVHERFNKEILRVSVPKTENLKRVRRAFSRMEDQLRAEYGKVPDLPTLVKDLEMPSGFLDSVGYGLKARRQSDGELRTIYSRIENLRDLSQDRELDDLIGYHIRYTEHGANMLLALRRGMRVRSFTNVGISDLISTKMRIELELVESRMDMVGHYIRSRIGERIKRLESESRAASRGSQKKRLARS